MYNTDAAHGLFNVFIQSLCLVFRNSPVKF